MYRVFTRTWWKIDPVTRKRVPGAGRRYHHRNPETNGWLFSYEAAIAYCKQWNNAHKPGRLSRKCELESAK